MESKKQIEERLRFAESMVDINLEDTISIAEQCAEVIINKGENLKSTKMVIAGTTVSKEIFACDLEVELKFFISDLQTRLKNLQDAKNKTEHFVKQRKLLTQILG